MSITNVENLFYKTVEYVPGVGTLYALGRSLGYAKTADGKEKVLVNKYGTITHRDGENKESFYTKARSGELLFSFDDPGSNNYYKFQGQILLNKESEKNKLSITMTSEKGGNQTIELQRQTTFSETS